MVRRKKLGDEQAPFAALLTCADARVAPALLFDQELGDLYVVSSAGPTVDKTVIGSLQHGVATLGVPLLVVLGYTGCDVTAAASAALGQEGRVVRLRSRRRARRAEAGGRGRQAVRRRRRHPGVRGGG